jgi:hypothetical protein
MDSSDIDEICKAIKNCTDIIAEETNVQAKNVIFFTHLDYGHQN